MKPQRVATTYMFEEKSVMLAYMLFSSQHESTLLAVSLFVCLSLSSSRCAKWAASAHVQIFPATKGETAKIQTRFYLTEHSCSNLLGNKSMSVYYMFYFGCAAVLYVCNSKPRVYHKTQTEGFGFGFCWLLPLIIYVQYIEKHVCHQQMYKLCLHMCQFLLNGLFWVVAKQLLDGCRSWAVVPTTQVWETVRWSYRWW